MDGDGLDVRLAAAGVPSGLSVQDAWRRLREVEGARATVIDLYALVAGQRGITAEELPLEERIPLARSVMPHVWPGFTVTGGSERVNDTIRVLAYDRSWPDRFEQWRRALTACLALTARRIEHIGSTSVPGLPAKPIIDVQVSVVDLQDEAQYVPPLERAGLQLRSRDDLHRYFRPFADRPRDVHVHVCAVDSAWERDHLLFRDYLRAHPQAHQTYATAKRKAARAWSDDGIAYTDAKSSVILNILDQAQRWSTDTGQN